MFIAEEKIQDSPKNPSLFAETRFVLSSSLVSSIYYCSFFSMSLFAYSFLFAIAILFVCWCPFCWYFSSSCDSLSSYKIVVISHLITWPGSHQDLFTCIHIYFCYHHLPFGKLFVCITSWIQLIKSTSVLSIFTRCCIYHVRKFYSAK